MEIIEKPAWVHRPVLGKEMETPVNLWLVKRTVAPFKGVRKEKSSKIPRFFPVSPGMFSEVVMRIRKRNGLNEQIPTPKDYLE